MPADLFGEDRGNAGLRVEDSSGGRRGDAGAFTALAGLTLAGVPAGLTVTGAPLDARHRCAIPLPSVK